MEKKPYNPLEKKNLAESIVRAMLESATQPLSKTSHLVGAGVYVIYYTGAEECYAPVSALNKGVDFRQPIYIGKAIPKGGRKGALIEGSSATGVALRDRLAQHYSSVSEAENLDAKDFHYRCLMLDDVWIPLGENMLIEQFKPVWNRVIDGFGNKAPGGNRSKQQRSPWDVIHPGRKFAKDLGENTKTNPEKIKKALEHYFKTGRVLKSIKEAAVVDGQQTFEQE